MGSDDEPRRLEPLPSHSSLHPSTRTRFHLLSTHATSLHVAVSHASPSANLGEDQKVQGICKSTIPAPEREFVLMILITNAYISTKEDNIKMTSSQI